MADRVRLLVEHGVDVRSPFTTRSFGIAPQHVGRTPVDLARLTGSTDVAEVLVAAGVEVPDLDPVDAIVAAVLAGDLTTAEQLRRADDGLLRRVADERPVLVLDAVATGRPSSGRDGHRPEVRPERRGRSRSRPVHGRDRPPRSGHER